MSNLLSAQVPVHQKQMDSYEIPGFDARYLKLTDVCARNKLDYDTVVTRICGSRVVFANIDNLFVTGVWLSNLLGSDLDLDEFDHDVLISLD